MFKHLCILFFSIPLCILLEAQDFKLIDVNKTRNSTPDRFAVLKGVFYFRADDGIHGSELFASDGSAKGTKLVKDIFPGTGSSNISEIVVSGKKIYFIAADSVNKQKIWVSDGSDTGTKPLNNITTPLTNSGFLFLTNVNGSLYFNYSYTDHNNNSRNELWKTDSTGTGGLMITNFNIFIDQMANVGDRLFFTLFDDNSSTGKELYTSDGTPEGTKLVADINPNSAGSNPSHLTALNGLLYFAANDGTGNKLWVSDGTAPGTHSVKNPQNIQLSQDFVFGNVPFAVKQNTIFLKGYSFDSATSASTGYELCKYNSKEGSPGVRLVKNIIPDKKSSNPGNITTVKGTVFFTIMPDSADAELWKSDGTRAGTVLVKNINPGGQNNYYGFTNINGTLLFSYTNNTLGTELWKSNGTPSGTVLVKDIFPGLPGSSPRNLTHKNGITLFSANSSNGFELWKTDGTDTGTVLVKDINTRTTSSSSPTGFTALKNHKIIFRGVNGKASGNLFVTNGTSAGTILLDSLITVGNRSNTRELFTLYKNEAWFTNFSGKLFKTNGTKTGTVPLGIPDVVDINSGYITYLVATEKLLYIFTYNSNINQAALWRTNGTSAGTFILKSNFAGNYQLFPTVIGETLFFAAYGINTGSELWKTDGSPQGTKLVKTIGGLNNTPVANLYNFNGKLFFEAFKQGSNVGPVLWTSDGTEAGTVIFKDIPLIQQPFAQANGKLFFYALDTLLQGYELFASDGTTTGTSIVKDINTGDASSNVYVNPSSLIGGDTLLYFIANDGKHGAELWKSDGTKDGTKQLKDITPGIKGTNFNFAVNVHDHLFFTVNDKLWHSDGTKSNTHQVKDEDLKNVTRINSMAAIGDSLYFSGYTYDTGQELYFGSVKIKPPAITLTIADRVDLYIAPANIKFNAVATDEDGTITRVEFYDSNILLHTDLSYPYEFLWTDVPAGNYKITAKATDNNGNVTVAENIDLFVAEKEILPVVSMINPVRNPSSATGKTGTENVAVVKLSPDPVFNTLQISVSGQQFNTPSVITLISTAGASIKTLRSNNLSKGLQLDVSFLPKGMYTIRIINGNKVIYNQFIKL